MNTYRLADNVTMQQIGEESVLLNLSRGLYYRLDPVGTIMLAGLLQGQEEAQVIESVIGEYDIDTDSVKRDLHRILDEMRSQGLLSA